MAKKVVEKETAIETINVPLHTILPDEKQPRKGFNEEAALELAASVKKHGVLQSIALRELDANKSNGLKYKVIYGHRRLWAAKKAGLKTIPATIRRVSDEEATEIQLVENIQRENVHPVDEAASIAELLKTNSTKDVAAMIGKSETFVLKRANLTNLIDQWKRIFRAEKITITAAQFLCSLAEDYQLEILEDVQPSDWDGEAETFEKVPTRNILDCDKEHYLNDASFDINDSVLVPSVGSCVGCKFNTMSIPLLFEVGVEEAVCNNPTCFKIKEEAVILKQVEKAAATPDRIYANTSYYLTTEEERKLGLAKEHGVNVLDRSMFSVVKRPELETFEEWLDYHTYDEDEMEEARTEWKDAMEDIKEEIETYEEEEAAGLYKEATVFIGADEGKTVLIKLNTKALSKSTELDNASGKNGVSGIETEIARLEEREKRAKELDAEKVWAKILALRNDNGDNVLISTDDFTSEAANLAAIKVLSKSLHYTIRRKAENWVEENTGKVPPSQIINYLLRALIVHTLPNAAGSHVSGMSYNKEYYDYAKELMYKEVAQIELEQQGVTDERVERLSKRISALKKTVKA